MNDVDINKLVLEVESIYLNPTDVWLNWPLSYRYSLPSKFDIKDRRLGLALVSVGIIALVVIGWKK